MRQLKTEWDIESHSRNIVEDHCIEVVPEISDELVRVLGDARIPTFGSPIDGRNFYDPKSKREFWVTSITASLKDLGYYNNVKIAVIEDPAGSDDIDAIVNEITQIYWDNLVIPLVNVMRGDGIMIPVETDDIWLTGRPPVVHTSTWFKGYVPVPYDIPATGFNDANQLVRVEYNTHQIGIAAGEVYSYEVEFTPKAKYIYPFVLWAAALVQKRDMLKFLGIDRQLFYTIAASMTSDELHWTQENIFDSPDDPNTVQHRISYWKKSRKFARDDHDCAWFYIAGNQLYASGHLEYTLLHRESLPWEEAGN